MELIESKSILAKLMATENLHIEQRHVPTASFDVQNRILTIPILEKGISTYLYDLFLGHEVAHALWTPLDGLHKAHELNYSLSVMNVLEDSRIERKIKIKYPGIRQSFIRAYKELVDQDFFGTEGQDLNELNFIDRVNLYCKGGSITNIKFNEVETDILKEIENTQTYDDVLDVYKKVADYMKKIGENEEAKEFDLKNLPINVKESDEGSEQSDESIEIQIQEKGKSGQNGEKEEKKEAGEKGKKEENSGTNESTDGTGGNSGSKEAPGTGGFGGKKEPVSKTDEAYRRNENRLFSTKQKDEIIYGNVPDLNLDHYIIDYSKLWVRYEKDCKEYDQKYSYTDSEHYVKKQSDLFLKFREDSKKVVSYLVKEFELRKNADQLKRATVSKTGELNMSKIFSYNFSEDLFKKITVIPGGKSHGLVMFIDWSGSMADHIDNTIKQLLNLVMFCKKVNIPYEVYSFTSEYEDEYGSKQNMSDMKYLAKRGDMIMSPFKLLNLLSNRMPATIFAKAAGALLGYKNLNRYRMPAWLNLGGTPLNESIVAAMKIIPKFQKENRLQVVNTVFLTDGEASQWIAISDGAGNYINDSYITRTQRIVIRDPITKNEVMVNDPSKETKLTTAYINLLKARTKCNIVGFYILSGRNFSGVIPNFYPNLKPHEYEKLRKEFKSDKYSVVTTAGFDEYYLIRSENLDTDEDIEFEVKEDATMRNIASAFSKFSSSRKTSRVVLNRFIELIA
jgi:hypothetical protein